MPYDWRNVLRLAADLALLGIVVTVLSLPLLTAGAAVSAGSVAIQHQLAEGRWPSLAECWQAFRRRLLTGLAAGPLVLLAAALVVVDVSAVRRGAVPGGALALVAVLAVGLLGAGWAALVAVRAGVVESGASRSALAAAMGRPAMPVAAAGLLLVAALLSVLVHPVLAPVLVGYTLFALHVVARRLTPAMTAGPVSADAA
jgi:hypothetical protein